MSVSDKILRTFDRSKDGVKVDVLGRLFASSDQQGHQFVISIRDDGQPVDLTGATVSGVFVNANGDTVALPFATYGSIDAVNSAVTLTLADGCYVVKGHFDLYVNLTQSGETHAVYHGQGYITPATGSGSAIDPGTVISDVSTLIAQVGQAQKTMSQQISAIEAAGQEVIDSIPPTYDALSYQVNTINYALEEKLQYVSTFPARKLCKISKLSTAGVEKAKLDVDIIDSYDCCYMIDGSVAPSATRDYSWSEEVEGETVTHTIMRYLFTVSPLPDYHGAGTSGSTVTPAACLGAYIDNAMVINHPEQSTGKLFVGAHSTGLFLSVPADSGVPTAIADLRTYLAHNPVLVFYKSADVGTAVNLFCAVEAINNEELLTVKQTAFEFTSPLMWGNNYYQTDGNVTIAATRIGNIKPIFPLNFGLRVNLPEGWDGWVRYSETPVYGAPITSSATFGPGVVDIPYSEGKYAWLQFRHKVEGQEQAITVDEFLSAVSFEPVPVTLARLIGTQQENAYHPVRTHFIGDTVLLRGYSMNKPSRSHSSGYPTSNAHACCTVSAIPIETDERLEINVTALPNIVFGYRCQFYADEAMTVFKGQTSTSAYGASAMSDSNVVVGIADAHYVTISIFAYYAVEVDGTTVYTAATGSYLYDRVDFVWLDRIADSAPDVPDTSIVTLNHDRFEPIVNALRPNNEVGTNHNFAYKLQTQPLCLLHFSDIHSDAIALNRIIEFWKKYKAYPLSLRGYTDQTKMMIDDCICTGDLVASNMGSDWRYWSLNENAHGILLAIGNHDVLDANAEAISAWKAGETYIKPFYQNWNVSSTVTAQMENDSGETVTGYLTYYYKDYAERKIRLIVLNYMRSLSEQLTWLKAALAECSPNGAKSDYSVVIAVHGPPDTVGTFIEGNCNFNSLDREVTGQYLPDSWLAAVQTFIDGGGKFACWFGGHTHRDMILRGPVVESGTYPGDYSDQLFIIVDAANRDQSDSVSAHHRINGQRSEDLANLMIIDTVSHELKVIRIGANCDRHLRQQNYLCLDYSTGRIIAQS